MSDYVLNGYMKVKNIYKYFCNLEKKKYVLKAVCFIHKDNGDIIHDSNAITKETKLFFMKICMPHEKMKL